MKEEKQELRYGKNVEWFLNELAAYEFSDLSDGEIEVYGEDTSGCEGSCTVDVTDLAADAAQLISKLREKLLQRDEQIAELQEDNAMLRDTRAGLSRECNAFEKQIAAQAADIQNYSELLQYHIDRQAKAEALIGALTAENLRLKSASLRLCEKYIANKGSDLEFISCYTPSKSSIGTGGVWDMWREIDSILNNTLATDTSAEELRAKGAEAVAAYHKERVDALVNVDRRGANDHKVSYMAAMDVANKLREGNI